MELVVEKPIVDVHEPAGGAGATQGGAAASAPSSPASEAQGGTDHPCEAEEPGLEDGFPLLVNGLLRVMDIEGVWFCGQVVAAAADGSSVTLRYDGFDRTNDEELDLPDDIDRLASYSSATAAGPRRRFIIDRAAFPHLRVNPEALLELSPKAEPVRTDKIAVGVLVEARTFEGTWWGAQVIEVDGERVRVHFDGIEPEWDEWIDLRSELKRVRQFDLSSAARGQWPQYLIRRRRRQPILTLKGYHEFWERPKARVPFPTVGGLVLVQDAETMRWYTHRVSKVEEPYFWATCEGYAESYDTKLHMVEDRWDVRHSLSDGEVRFKEFDPLIARFGPDVERRWDWFDYPVCSVGDLPPLEKLQVWLKRSEEGLPGIHLHEHAQALLDQGLTVDAIQLFGLDEATLKDDCKIGPAATRKALCSAADHLKGLTKEIPDDELPIYRRVYIQSFFLSLHTICDADMTFTCEFGIYFGWEIANDAPEHEMGEGVLDLEKIWRPELYFPNCVDPPTIDSEVARLQDNMVIYKVTGHGSFHEILELQRFPYDRQELRICVSHNREKQPNFEVELYDYSRLAVEYFKKRQEAEADNKELAAIQDRPRDLIKVKLAAYPQCPPPLVSSIQSEWRPDSAYVRPDTKKQYDAPRPGLQLIGCFERRSDYYIWTYGFILFLICSLPCVSLVNTADNVGDRFSVTLTLLLTATAFKYVIAANMPRVHYNTYLDKYVIISFLYLFVYIIQNAIAGMLSRWSTQRAADVFDICCLTVFSGTWILFHVFIFFGSRFGWFRQKWELVSISQSYEKVFLKDSKQKQD